MIGRILSGRIYRDHQTAEPVINIVNRQRKTHPVEIGIIFLFPIQFHVCKLFELQANCCSRQRPVRHTFKGFKAVFRSSQNIGNRNLNKSFVQTVVFPRFTVEFFRDNQSGIITDRAVSPGLHPERSYEESIFTIEWKLKIILSLIDIFPKCLIPPFENPFRLYREVGRFPGCSV